MRTERDSMGEMPVPDEALHGAFTRRAVLNFPISGQPVNSRKRLHPNEDIDRGQSSDDAIPTTLHVSLAKAARATGKALHQIELEKKLMDAATLGRALEPLSATKPGVSNLGAGEG